jgi:DNA-binding MarR family transcriptional regulator
MTFDRSIGYLVRYTHRAFVKALASELAPHGVSPAEWAVFRVLWESEGYSQVELARRMRIEKASLTGVLLGMEQRGLLKRTRDGNDKRRAVLTLTAKGRALRGKLVACATRVNRRATLGITRESVSMLGNLLAQTTANLEREPLKLPTETNTA